MDTVSWLRGKAACKFPRLANNGGMGGSGGGAYFQTNRDGWSSGKELVASDLGTEDTNKGHAFSWSQRSLCLENWELDDARQGRATRPGERRPPPQPTTGVYSREVETALL